MPKESRPASFWIILIFLTFSCLVMLLGQTLAIFDYDLTVRLGLQESVAEVSEFGVQVNRAFGVGDTIIYIPLMAVSIPGLWLRRRWSLVTTASAAGVSAYWAVTVAFMMGFLSGTPGYSLQPGLEYVVFVGAYIVFGVWGFTSQLSEVKP